MYLSNNSQLAEELFGRLITSFGRVSVIYILYFYNQNKISYIGKRGH